MLSCLWCDAFAAGCCCCCVCLGFWCRLPTFAPSASLSTKRRATDQKHFDLSVQLNMTISNRDLKCYIVQRPRQRQYQAIFKKKSAKFNHQNTFHHKSISKKKLTPTENDSNSARSLLDVASRVSVGPEVERKFRSFCVVCCLEALYGGYFCVRACMHI